MTSPNKSGLSDEPLAELLFSLLDADERNIVVGTPERAILDGSFNLVNVAEQLLSHIKDRA